MKPYRCYHCSNLQSVRDTDLNEPKCLECGKDLWEAIAEQEIAKDPGERIGRRKLRINYSHLMAQEEEVED